MEKDLAELQERRLLSDLKAVAVETVDRFSLKRTTCRMPDGDQHDGNFTQIDRVDQHHGHQEVAAALGEELMALGVSGISVAMQPILNEGEDDIQARLEVRNGAVPQDILSEGEQRAIAIAAFLPRSGSEKAQGGIVFDDPVSSLDHARRERAARRIAAEARERQVVVFTHDMYFLNVLMFEATALGLTPKALTLNQTPEGFGVAEETLPFAGANVSQRVGMLRNKQVECGGGARQGTRPATGLSPETLYNDLRMAWERGVEEVCSTR